MTRQNSFFFIAIISKIKSLSIVVTDKSYDSEDNHVLVRELHYFSVIHPRDGRTEWELNVDTI